MSTQVLDPVKVSAPPEDGTYFQCLLRQGGLRTVGWIEERGAKRGAKVEIKGDPEMWTVVDVYPPPRGIRWIRDKQRMDRGSLGSIKGVGSKRNKQK